MRIHRNLLAGVTVVTLPMACTAYHPPPVPPQASSVAPDQLAQLTRGHEIHQAKCANCHAFENPANYHPTELTATILPKMARKAGLSATEQEAVAAYLLAVRTR